MKTDYSLFMTSEQGESGRNGLKLEDIVRDADEYYAYLKGKHVHETRLDVLVVGLVTWFASFAVIGLGAFWLYGGTIYLVATAFIVAVIMGGGAGLMMWIVRRRRGFKFAELGELLSRMKQGKASAEDGIRLMDTMQQVSLTVRKRRLDSAFEYGIVAFALVALVGMNAGIGALAGVVVYLYFRYEALREYEKGEDRYEESKKQLLQSF